MKKRKSYIFFVISMLVILTVFTGCATKERPDEKKSNEVTDEAVKKEMIIDTKELSEKLESKEMVIVDVRSEAQYNGWKLEGETRGGHIKGAVDFPFSWTKDIEDEKLIEILKNKGITQDKTIVIYDTSDEKSLDMKTLLSKLGYKNVLVYEKGLKEWASDESLPMDRLANYEKLVYPKWINQLINDEKPDTYINKAYKIIEVSWGEGEDYKKEHIPGAFHLDTGEIEEEPLWNKKSDKDIEKVLLKYGITYDTTVILYGADTTAAARGASIMMYAGVEDVRILNGGFEAWKSTGYEVEKDVLTPVAVKDFGKKIPVHPEYIIDINEAKNILADENGELVSIRSWAEYIGETSGYTYIKPKGRIAGAVWGHAGSDAYHMEDFRNINNTMRNYHEIESIWKEWKITPEKKVSFFCGTGWRASETFFYAYLMGWENISVFDGGWYEWSMDESNQIELGEPK